MISSLVNRDRYSVGVYQSENFDNIKIRENIKHLYMGNFNDEFDNEKAQIFGLSLRLADIIDSIIQLNKNDNDELKVIAQNIIKFYEKPFLGWRLIDSFLKTRKDINIFLSQDLFQPTIFEFINLYCKKFKTNYNLTMYVKRLGLYIIPFLNVYNYEMQLCAISCYWFVNEYVKKIKEASKIFILPQHLNQKKFKECCKLISYLYSISNIDFLNIMTDKVFEKIEFNVVTVAKLKTPIYFLKCTPCSFIDPTTNLKSDDIINDGTFGFVKKQKINNSDYAVKTFKKYGEDFNELINLNCLQHQNICILRGYGSNSLAFDLCSTDLHMFMNTVNTISKELIKSYMFQLINAVAYCHSNNVFHLDIKTSNILLLQNGYLKLCDFGTAKRIGYPHLFSGRVGTSYMFSPPEVLQEIIIDNHTSKNLSSIDMWSVGCIFITLLTHKYLFSGKTVLEIYKSICRCKENVDMYGWSFYEIEDILTIDLLNSLLSFYPNNRITSFDALKHKYFESFTSKHCKLS